MIHQIHLVVPALQDISITEIVGYVTPVHLCVRAVTSPAQTVSSVQVSAEPKHPSVIAMLAIIRWELLIV